MLVRLVVVVALIIVATLTASLAMAQGTSRGATGSPSRLSLDATAQERITVPLASIAR